MQGRHAALKSFGVVAACMLAFSACSGGSAEPSGLPDKPDKDDSAPKTPKGTPTPTPPSPSPVSSDKFDSWTAVRHYQALTGYAFETGDTEPLKDLSTPDCESCQGTIEMIEKVYDAGGHFEGDYAGHIEEVTGSEELVNVYIKYGEAREISKTGAEPKMYEPENRNDTFSLTREGNQWVVAKIDTQSAD